MNDLGGMLSDAMKDPRFASILSTLKEKADSGEIDLSSLASQIQQGEAKPEAAPEAASEAAPRARAAVGMENHKRLLSALKPYLADEKRGAVEEILKISEFSGIIEALTKNSGGR